MPTIEMSSGFSSGITSRIMRFGTFGNTSNSNSGHSGLLSADWAIGGISGYPTAHMYLMKGTVPTGPLANLSARSADILVTFISSNNPTGGHFQTSNVSVNPAQISTEYIAASASGTATWFWWLVAPNNTVSQPIINPTATPFHQIIGTVGLTASGSDMEMPNTTITAGELYRVMNLRIQFPTSWTY